MPKDNQPTFADILAETIGKAVTDIRQHVVEEPWFGQVLREYPAPEADLNNSPPIDLEY